MLICVNIADKVILHVLFLSKSLVTPIDITFVFIVLKEIDIVYVKTLDINESVECFFVNLHITLCTTLVSEVRASKRSLSLLNGTLCFLLNCNQAFRIQKANEKNCMRDIHTMFALAK